MFDILQLGQYGQKYLKNTPPPSEPIKIPIESEMCDFVSKQSYKIVYEETFDGLSLLNG